MLAGQDLLGWREEEEEMSDDRGVEEVMEFAR